MPVLLLNEDEVRQLLTMEMALAAVEAGLRKLALDEGVNIPRARAQTDHAMLHSMAASAKTLGYMGYKCYATSRRGSAFHVGLYDGKTAALLALVQADYLGQVRTGAASGVATQFMARHDAAEVGIFVDSKGQARIEAGDFVQALEDGSIHWADIHELGQVIVGRYTGRAHAEDVTMFKSLGIAIEDVALAAKVYEKARETGVGRVIDG